MAILLYIGSFVLTLLIFYLKSEEGRGFREAFLKASLIHGLIIAVSTELLSTFSAFQYYFVLGLWGSVCAATASIAISIATAEHKKERLFDLLPSRFRSKLRKTDAIDKIGVLVTVVILGFTLVTAMVSPPNNMDSMSYHMPRVMHWIQNASISHYPTDNVRQISFPPGAGYSIAHFVILSGNDYFANMVQWLSFLGCILGTSLVAARFSNRKGQIISALICATIPMAILQSVTTQTDLTVAFWLVCSAYFVLRTKNYSIGDLAWISLAFSLAVLTKPTAYFFGLPLGIALALRYAHSSIKGTPFVNVASKVLLMVSCVAIVSFFLSAPSFWRNHQTFGNFLGPDSGTRCEVIGLKPLASNLTRNIALSMPLPDYWKWVTTVHRTILELDVDDSRTTFHGNSFSKCPEWLFLLPDEDFAGNPLHLLLIIFTMCAVFIRSAVRRKPIPNEILILIFIVIGGVLILNFLIKWQVWGNRLHLTAYIFLAPVAGCVIADSRRPLVVILVAVLLFQGAIYSLFSLRHPLISLAKLKSPIFKSESIFQVPRESLYFNGNFEYMKAPIEELNKKLRSDKCQALGITFARPEFEYAVWAVLNQNARDKVKIKHLRVENPSTVLRQEFSDSDMCAMADVKMNRINYTALN